MNRPVESTEEKASNSLVQILKNHRERVISDPDAITSLLNDYCPKLAGERFKLAAAVQVSKFRNALTADSVDPHEVGTLAYSLQNRFGFSAATARWVENSWKVALGFPPSAPTSRAFRCPNCKHPGEAKTHWVDESATCPQCKSKVGFDQELRPMLERQGWKRKRQEGGAWELNSHRGKNDSDESLKTKILQVVSDESSSDLHIASEIGLIEIVDRLSYQISKILSSKQIYDLSKNSDIVVTSLLKATLAKYNIQIHPNIPGDRLTSAASRLTTKFEDQIIGYAGSQGEIPENILLFGASKFYFAGLAGNGSIDYQHLNSIPISLSKSITRFKIGDSRTVDIRGIGLPRQKLISTLMAISGSLKGIDDRLMLSRKTK